MKKRGQTTNSHSTGGLMGSPTGVCCFVGLSMQTRSVSPFFEASFTTAR